MINCDETPEPSKGGTPHPRCRCTPEEITAGHRHRCPAGPPTYLAVGEWDGLTVEEIESGETATD